MKALRRICAVLIGCVFFLAGTLKLMDPVGSGLVVLEYFNFLHLGFLKFASKATGVILALLETTVGAALICGVWKKVVAHVSGIMLLFFTILTFVLWRVNPNMDCGCFGEAIHLTHAQSLIKNLILCLLWAGAFIPLRNCTEGRKIKYASFYLACASSIAFMVFSLISIPLRDFTPYAPGTELTSLSFFDSEGEYHDSEALEGKVLIVSVFKTASNVNWEKIQNLISDAQECGFGTILLASDITPLDNYYADRRELLTLNRSNGGVTYVCDGQLITKWPSTAKLSKDKLKEIANSSTDELLTTSISSGKIKFQAYLLYAFAILLLL